MNLKIKNRSKQSIDVAKQFLNSGNYRLELGALVALSIMPEADIKKLPADVAAKVREFTTNSNATIRETSTRVKQRALH